MTEKFQFEKALEDLEKIVEAMESDELTFEHEREAYETFEAERAVEDGHEWPYG